LFLYTGKFFIGFVIQIPVSQCITQYISHKYEEIDLYNTLYMYFTMPNGLYIFHSECTSIHNFCFVIHQLLFYLKNLNPYNLERNSIWKRMKVIC